MFGPRSTKRKMKPIPVLCTMSRCVPIDGCRIWNVHFVPTSDIPPTCFGQTAGNAAVIYRQKELGAAPWRVLHQRIREWGVADDQHFPSIGAAACLGILARVIDPTASRTNTPPNKMNLAIGFLKFAPTLPRIVTWRISRAVTDVTPMSYQRHSRMRASGPGWWRAFPRAPRLAG